MKWPLDTQDSLRGHYGNPDVNGDGIPDPYWIKKNIVQIEPPYPMFLAWEPTKPLRSISIHRFCAISLKAVLEKINEHYPERERRKFGLDQYGGGFNFRPRRGGHTLSTHSYGAAIDLSPVLNAQGKPYDPATMMPLYVISLFEQEGWVWGGGFKTPDSMHFQAAAISGTIKT